MSLEGPVLVVAVASPSGLAGSLAGRVFPILEVGLPEAAAAVAALRPALVLVDGPAAGEQTAADALMQVADELGGPWTPVVRLAAPQDLDDPVWTGALRLRAGAGADRLVRRLAGFQRIRALDASVRRRSAALAADGGPTLRLPPTDPLADAAVLVVGRGRVYPGVALAFAERVQTVGAFGLEAAFDMMQARDIDGVVVCDGFAPQRVEWFLDHLGRDSAFRDLPVALVAAETAGVPTQLTGLDSFAEGDADLLPVMLPALRAHAFASGLRRLARAIEAEGQMDPRTNLLTPAAFRAQLAVALEDVEGRGVPLSIARLSFPGPTPPRLVADASRVLARLIRASDFGGGDDGGLLLALGDTDLKAAHAVVRRLASIVKHTTLDPMGVKLVPDVVLDVARPGDDVPALAKRIGARGI
jgi:hypothetical protein